MRLLYAYTKKAGVIIRGVLALFCLILGTWFQVVLGGATGAHISAEVSELYSH
jgi:hypothetical protein